MNKIATLVKRGWGVEINSDSQGWFDVTFSHNTWGDFSGYGEKLSEAINEAYKEAVAAEGDWFKEK